MVRNIGIRLSEKQYERLANFAKINKYSIAAVVRIWINELTPRILSVDELTEREIEDDPDDLQNIADTHNITTLEQQYSKQIDTEEWSDIDTFLDENPDLD